MAKRIMLAVVGAGLGALLGLIFMAMGLGSTALMAAAVAGAVIPLIVMGRPGR